MSLYYIRRFSELSFEDVSKRTGLSRDVLRSLESKSSCELVPSNKSVAALLEFYASHLNINKSLLTDCIVHGHRPKHLHSVLNYINKVFIFFSKMIMDEHEKNKAPFY